MFQWFHSASKSLSNLVEESIYEEDFKEKSKNHLHLTPLQSHLGVLKNKPKPLFHILPLELKLLIFSFIPPEDLVTSVCCVCREWMKLANDDRSWQFRFNREITQWNTYGFHPKFIENYCKKDKNNKENDKMILIPPPPFTDNYNKYNSYNNYCISWKEWYLQQYLHNSKLYLSPEQALKNIISKDFKSARNSSHHSSINVFSIPLRFRGQYNKYQKDIIFRIPIFGQAMNSSASGLLYSLMWNKESPLIVTGLHAGTEGIGSGVGFKVNSKRLNLAAIYGKNPMDLLYSKRFFEEADALIYVIDYYICDKDLIVASKELNLALSINHNIPLMIFCCEDLSSDYNNNNNNNNNDIIDNDIKEKRNPLQFIDSLNIQNANNRKWCIKHVKNVPDICKGLEWLASII